jgi:hypothetical protein
MEKSDLVCGQIALVSVRVKVKLFLDIRLKIEWQNSWQYER